MSGEGGKLKSAVIGRLLKYFLAYKWTVLLAVILMVASNLLALNGPRLSGFAINAAAEIDFGGGGAVPSEVFVYCAEMVACYALSALLSYLLSYVMIRLSQKIVYTMRRQVFEHLLELPVGYFDRNQTGEIVSHLSYSDGRERDNGDRLADNDDRVFAAACERVRRYGADIYSFYKV